MDPENTGNRDSLEAMSRIPTSSDVPDAMPLGPPTIQQVRANLKAHWSECTDAQQFTALANQSESFAAMIQRRMESEYKGGVQGAQNIQDFLRNRADSYVEILGYCLKSKGYEGIEWASLEYFSV